PLTGDGSSSPRTPVRASTSSTWNGGRWRRWGQCTPGPIGPTPGGRGNRSRSCPPSDPAPAAGPPRCRGSDGPDLPRWEVRPTTLRARSLPSPSPHRHLPVHPDRLEEVRVVADDEERAVVRAERALERLERVEVEV